MYANSSGPSVRRGDWKPKPFRLVSIVAKEEAASFLVTIAPLVSQSTYMMFERLATIPARNRLVEVSESVLRVLHVHPDAHDVLHQVLSLEEYHSYSEVASLSIEQGHRTTADKLMMMPERQFILTFFRRAFQETKGLDPQTLDLKEDL